MDKLKTRLVQVKAWATENKTKAAVIVAGVILFFILAVVL